MQIEICKLQTYSKWLQAPDVRKKYTSQRAYGLWNKHLVDSMRSYQVSSLIVLKQHKPKYEAARWFWMIICDGFIGL